MNWVAILMGALVAFSGAGSVTLIARLVLSPVANFLSCQVTFAGCFLIHVAIMALATSVIGLPVVIVVNVIACAIAALIPVARVLSGPALAEADDTGDGVVSGQ